MAQESLAAQLRPLPCSEGLQEGRQLRRLGRSLGQQQRGSRGGWNQHQRKGRNLHASYEMKQSQPKPRMSKPPGLPASLAVSPAVLGGNDRARLHSKYQKINQHRLRREGQAPGYTPALRLSVAFRAPSSPRTRMLRSLQEGILPAMARTWPLTSWLPLARTEDGVYITML